MPNWMYNTLRIHGQIDDINKVFDFIKGNKTKFDFNKVIPSPDTENYKNEGWYNWNSKNWGTKWNASSTKSKGENILKFQTAYGVPMPVILKLSTLFPEVYLIISYQAEVDKNIRGKIIIINGKEYFI